jgi:hypothetical protein
LFPLPSRGLGKIKWSIESHAPIHFTWVGLKILVKIMPPLTPMELKGL